MADFELVADGLRFPEGPVVMPDGSVILTEIASGKITRVAPDGSKETVATPGGVVDYAGDAAISGVPGVPGVPGRSRRNHLPGCLISQS